jgi:hypothetical protein
VNNFLDRCWPKVIKEQLRRIEESLSQNEGIKTVNNPFIFHQTILQPLCGGG